MSNIKWLGWVIVVVGSFLPLVHVPILGNWNYWALDNRLAVICWALSGVALLGIVLDKNILLKISSVALMLFFVFTIFAVKYKAMDSFGFVFVN